jgi:hypothetical protein
MGCTFEFCIRAKAFRLKVNRSNARRPHTSAIEAVPASKQYLAPEARGGNPGGETSARYGK